VRLADTHEAGCAAWRGFWSVAEGCAADRRDVLLLGGARVVSQGLAIAEAAAVAEAAAGHGWTVLGGPPALRFLVSRQGGDTPPEKHAPTPFKSGARPVWAAPQRLARALLLTPPTAWLKLLSAPDGVALSHNAAMHAYAHENRCAVRFLHCDELMREAWSRTDSTAAPPPWIQDTAEQLAKAIASGRSLGPEMARRYMALAVPFAREQLGLAHATLDAARRLPDLPKDAWIGGQLTARYLATEIRRRGGHVTAFEHGWGASCERAQEITAYAEFGVADRYVALTPESARRHSGSAAHVIASPQRRIEFLAGAGDLDARRLPLARTRAPGARPRVVYAPTIIAGWRQFVPPLLPDPVHLDWQSRLSEALMAMPINFVCRPHPEGIFRGKPHPLCALLDTSENTFERLMGETDVFVFDFQQSTTFGRALCSDRPIVLVDFGLKAWNEDMDTAIRRRCRVVAARFDERNRPHIDAAALKDAVLSRPGERMDATFFRTLLLGKA